MTRHRPKDRKNKGNSYARLLGERALKRPLRYGGFIDKSKYSGADLRALRMLRGVGRPPQC
jgi:hypothetical protein